MSVKSTIREILDDYIAERNITNLAMAPSMAIGQLYVTTAWHTSQSMANSVQAQFNSYNTMNAATIVGIQALYRDLESNTN